MLDLLERTAFGLLPAAAHLGSALLLFRTEVENYAGPAGEEGIWLAAAHLGSALLLFRTEVENCAVSGEEKGIWLVISSCSPWL